MGDVDGLLRRQLAEIKRRARWLRRRRSAAGAQANAERARVGHRNTLEALGLGGRRPLASVAPGVVREIDGQTFYLVRPVDRDLDPTATVEAAAFGRARRWPPVVSCSPPPGDLAEAWDLDPRRVLFLDIETAGLSANTYLFLCGLMFLEDGHFVAEQAFARDYTEERGLLLHVRETMQRFAAVVTYNGASFDLPFVRTRMAVHRIAPPKPLASVDLLHTARRVFRDILPNRKLVTVERHLRGTARRDDVPSYLIPAAWHEFVRTGDARTMGRVLYHNRMDLFAMAVLVNRLSENADAIL